MKCVFMTIFIVLLFVATKTFAYQIVFRSDKRSPEEVYRTGFPQLGDNDNILRHVEGESCLSGTGDTAFVATSTSNNFAIEFAQNVPAGESFWVYSIRPTNNFYSAYDSLMNAYRQTHNGIFENTANSFREQGEYMAFGGIAREQIMGAWLYRSNGYGIPATRLSYTTNPNYQEDSTDVNSQPYPHYYLPTPSSSMSISSCERCINSTSPLLQRGGGDLASRIINCRYLYTLLLSK